MRACVTGEVQSILGATAIQRYLADYPDSHQIGEPVLYDEYELPVLL